MTTTLGDVLLVLLADAPGGALELQQRHAEALGPGRRVDISRVVSTAARLERLHYIRQHPALSRGPRRVWQLTESGQRRQRSWILDLSRDADQEDILVRVLLAVATADRATFETVIGQCLGLLELRRLRAAPRHPAAVSAADARAELDDALATATLDWLRRLREGTRLRDRAG